MSRPGCSAVCAVCLLVSTAARAEDAETPAAFRSDSAAAEPFRRLEAGETGDAAKPAATRGSDSAAGIDSVTAKLIRRRPAVSIWVGADFSDFDAKESFKADFARRLADDSLESLQSFEEAHLAFPAGLQAALPIGAWFDLVALARFSWYEQTAILGRKDHSSAGEMRYAVQSSLGGLGLRYYVPPSLFSVNDGLGLYAQMAWMWNLGASEIYTDFGSARARFDATGSGYDLQFGIRKSFKGSWQITGSLGFLKQEFVSDTPWSGLLHSAPPVGNAEWGSSSVQAIVALWYHFGAPPGEAEKKVERPATAN